jgi:hypothetical protein
VEPVELLKHMVRLTPIIILAISGCSAGARSASTGADAAAKAFYVALIQNESATAYGKLDAQSRERVTAEDFAALVENYRKRLGFQPAEVQIRACEEHGAEAVAHVVLVGKKDQKRGAFKDAIHLKQSESGWVVLLPPGFGRLQ